MLSTEVEVRVTRSIISSFTPLWGPLFMMTDPAVKEGTSPAYEENNNPIIAHVMVKMVASAEQTNVKIRKPDEDAAL